MLFLDVHRTFRRRRQWHSTPVLLPGKSHGRRSLVLRAALLKQDYLSRVWDPYTEVQPRMRGKTNDAQGSFQLRKPHPRKSQQSSLHPSSQGPQPQPCQFPSQHITIWNCKSNCSLVCCLSPPHDHVPLGQGLLYPVPHVVPYTS